MFIIYFPIVASFVIGKFLLIWPFIVLKIFPVVVFSSISCVASDHQVICTQVYVTGCYL